MFNGLPRIIKPRGSAFCMFSVFAKDVQYLTTRYIILCNTFEPIVHMIRNNNAQSKIHWDVEDGGGQNYSDGSKTEEGGRRIVVEFCKEETKKFVGVC